MNEERSAYLARRSHRMMPSSTSQNISRRISRGRTAQKLQVLATTRRMIHNDAKMHSRFPIVRHNANFRRVKQFSAATFCYISKSRNPQGCQCASAKILVTFRLAGDICETKPNAPIRVERRAFCPPIEIEQSSPRLVEYFSSTRCAKEANAARGEMRALPPERFV